MSAEPDIRAFERNIMEDQFVILASDGLWDVMSSQDAVDHVRDIMSGAVKLSSTGQIGDGRRADQKAIRDVLNERRKKIGQLLAEEALRRGTTDNVSVIVVWLRAYQH